MKKTISLLFAALICIIAVSCGKQPGSTTDPISSPVTTPETSAVVTPSPTLPVETPAAPEQTEQVSVQTPDEFTLTEANYPRVDGSTATIPLGEALAATLLGIPREDAASFALFSGTANAVERLHDGFADLIIVYEPAESTMQQYGQDMQFVKIGRDALVFLVNAANPIDSLSPEQIVGIYTGEFANWSEVGGDDGDIIPYQRNETSGSQAWFRKLVIGDRDLPPPPSALVQTEMGGLVSAIASYDNGPRAIGFNMYYYVTQMKNDENVKRLAVDGVIPSNETIRSGEYPYINDFYVAIRIDEPNTTAAFAIFNWLQTRQGAALLEHEGYVPLL